MPLACCLGELVTQISQGVEAEADQMVEIVVQAQQQKASEAGCQGRKGFLPPVATRPSRLLQRSAKLAERLGNELLEAGEHYE